VVKGGLEVLDPFKITGEKGPKNVSILRFDTPKTGHARETALKPMAGMVPKGGLTGRLEHDRLTQQDTFAGVQSQRSFGA
jgi:hypothetical protein